MDAPVRPADRGAGGGNRGGGGCRFISSRPTAAGREAEAWPGFTFRRWWAADMGRSGGAAGGTGWSRGKASKKSSTAAIWFILHLMKMPGANLLVVRQVYRTHLDSTMPSSAGRSGACGWASLAGLQEPAGAHLPADRAADPVRGFDDVNKLASTTVERGGCAGCGWRKRMSWTARRNSTGWTCRSRGGGAGPLFKQTTLTFNPLGRLPLAEKAVFDRPHPDVLP